MLHKLTKMRFLKLMGLCLILMSACGLKNPSSTSMEGQASGAYPTAMPQQAYGQVENLSAGSLFSVLPSDGLGTEVRDLALDARGNLWVATQIGLGCWDGERWTTYHTADTPLPHDDVRALAIAPDGVTLWVGTAGGLARFDGDTWRVYQKELASPVIADLDFDNQGRLWIATSFGGVSVYDGVLWSQYDKYNSGLLGLSVSALTAGPDGRVWMVDDFNDGVSMLDGRRWTHYTEETSGLVDHRIKQIMVDYAQRVWFVTPYMLNVLDGDTWNPFDMTPFFEQSFFPWCLAQTTGEEIWIAGLQYEKPTVYKFALDGSEINIRQVYEIPARHPVKITSILPAGRVFSQTTSTTVTQWILAEPQVLLPDGGDAWLGTSFGLYHLAAGGTVTVPLPNAEPPSKPFVQKTNNPFVDFVQVYEFHPTSIRVLAVGTVEVQRDYHDRPPLSCDYQGGPDLYNPHDVTEFMISENIMLCHAAGFESYFRPVDPPPVGERFTYWMHEVVNRLPHLHTPDPIEPERFYHFGLRASPPDEGMHWLKVLAFPISTEIFEVHGTLPTAEVILEGWRLFIYDVCYSYRPHIDFVLHDDFPAPSVRDYLEAAGWEVSE